MEDEIPEDPVGLYTRRKPGLEVAWEYEEGINICRFESIVAVS